MPEREHLSPLPVVFLMGPTGAGKSACALRLAAEFPLDIVNVDSAQIYRGLDIGTAKPDPTERAAVPHHLLDLCDPAESYSAARFRTDALAAIARIHAAGRIPLLTGGTGLYFKALEFGLAELPAADPALRAELQAELATLGNSTLHARLREIDPESAARIHPNDPQRLLRALEIYRQTGQALSAHWRATIAQEFPYRTLKWVVAPAARENLHTRLAVRFGRMLERGLVNEVLMLRQRPDLSLNCPALRAVGYRAVWRHLAGELTYPDMVEQAIAATRQLAKRQLTWFRGVAHATGIESDAPTLVATLAASLRAFLAITGAPEAYDRNT